MIAQVILTTLLCVIVLYAWRECRRSPVVAALSFVVAVSAIYLVWTPSHASDLAHWAGVGRGVDLIIYVWVVISLLVMFNLHLKLRSQLELITELARWIALSKASETARVNQPVTIASPPKAKATLMKSPSDNGAASGRRRGPAQ